MKVTVRFTGLLRRLAERESLHLDLWEGAILRQALISLKALMPEEFAGDVLGPLLSGEDMPAILLLNRSSVHTTDQLDDELHDGDIIAFATPMEGG